MKTHTLESEQRLPVDARTVWDFFSWPRNLETLTPPEMGLRTVGGADGKVHEGQI